MEFMKWMKLIGLRLIEFYLFVGYGRGPPLYRGSIPFHWFHESTPVQLPWFGLMNKEKTSSRLINQLYFFN